MSQGKTYKNMWREVACHPQFKQPFHKFTICGITFMMFSSSPQQNSDEWKFLFH